jgi:hypothetical protein
MIRRQLFSEAKFQTETPIKFRLQNVGLLTDLYFALSGKLTASSDFKFKEEEETETREARTFTYFDLIKNIRVIINRAETLYQHSGFSAHLLSELTGNPNPSQLKNADDLTIFWHVPIAEKSHGGIMGAINLQQIALFEVEILFEPLDHIIASTIPPDFKGTVKGFHDTYPVPIGGI